MSKAQLTIYRIEPVGELTLKDFAKMAVDEYNEEYSAKKKITGTKIYYEKAIDPSVVLVNIEEVYFYIGSIDSKPTWSSFVNVVTGTNNVYQNLSYSWIMFLKVKNYFFAITAGYAHHLISGYLDSTFGIEILSGIYDPDERSIRSVSDKTLHGNRYGGTQFFSKEILLIQEKNINSYFKEVISNVTATKIESLLGIKLSQSTKSINVLAKESLKIHKSIGFKELDNLLEKITLILDDDKKDSINDYYKLTKRNKEYKELNENLNQKLVKWIQEELKGTLISLVLNYDLTLSEKKTIFADFSKEHEVFYNERDLFREVGNLYKLLVSSSKKVEINIIEDFFKKVRINGLSEGEETVKVRLFELIETKVILRDNTFYFINGDWFAFNKDFITEVNTRLIQKVKPLISDSVKDLELNIWPEDLDEGEFNISHRTNEGTFVLDKILSGNIEICDLLIEREDTIYLVHVKKGLAGDTRILSEQIMIASEALNGFILNNNVEIMEEYYRQIQMKLKTKTLSEVARKFIQRFESYKEFKEILLEKDIHFVFAYKSSNSILDVQKYTSTPAKISIIGLVDTMRNYPFKLHFVEIDSK